MCSRVKTLQLNCSNSAIVSVTVLSVLITLVHGLYVYFGTHEVDVSE